MLTTLRAFPESGAMSSRTSPSPARSSRSPTSTGSIESCRVESTTSAAPTDFTATSTKPFAPVDGAPGVAASKPRAGRLVRSAKPGVRPLRAAVGDLDRPEQLLLELVGVLLVELLVRLAERGERDGQLVDRLRDDVEEVLARFGVRVGHAVQPTTPGQPSPSASSGTP